MCEKHWVPSLLVKGFAEYVSYSHCQGLCKMQMTSASGNRAMNIVIGAHVSAIIFNSLSKWMPRFHSSGSRTIVLGGHELQCSPSCMPPCILDLPEIATFGGWGSEIFVFCFFKVVLPWKQIMFWKDRNTLKTFIFIHLHTLKAFRNHMFSGNFGLFMILANFHIFMTEPIETITSEFLQIIHHLKHAILLDVAGRA